MPNNSNRFPQFRMIRAFAFLCLVACGMPIRSQEPGHQDAQRPRRATTAPQGGPPSSPVEAPPDAVLRIDTDLVPVDVTATDPFGRPVRNLRTQDFRLFEDGIELPISFFNVEHRGGATRPVEIVFALDISGSMTPEELLRLRSAMNVFNQWLAERTSLFAVVSFGMNVKTLQPMTGDSRKFGKALDKLLNEPSGLSTHTYDAVDDAIRMLVRHAPRSLRRQIVKRAVVVVTDGFPVGDTVSVGTVIDRANAADVSVYTVTLPSYSRTVVSTERTPLPTPLDVSGLTENTGGTSVYATEKNFAQLFKALAEEVTSAYVLAFYPPPEARRDGRFHTIRVEGPPGLTLRQSRPGFKSR